MSHKGYETALRRIKKAKDSISLDLSGLNLTELPSELFELVDLQTLYLDNNQMAAIPDSLASLNNLKILDLSHNQIAAIPDSLASLANLQGISFDNNQIAAIPDSLASLNNLQVLYLSHNQIAAIPDFLGSLFNLQTLNLSSNQIAAIPDSLASLANLRTLYLSHNQIAAIPDSLGNLAELQSLYLHNNPDLGLPSELLGPTSDAVRENKPPADATEIIEYAKRVNANGKPLNEAKLILVGKGAVGKSSLVEKLIYDNFEPGKAKTEGINIERWEIPIKGDDIRLNVWDFGGQEIMHATHQFFLTERSLYLLVLNGREGNEDLEAEYWLKLIASFGANSPVIIVLNKIREHAFDLNRSVLQEKYPNIKAFVRTDCEDDESIKELRELIIRETDALDELRVKFPGEWFSIKDELATSERNYLSFEQYRERCAVHGVNVPRHQEMLAKYLNQLGIVLNYSDDPRLKDTHVLNPHWVTRGIYKILNWPKLEENKGEIRLGQISEILPEKDYPSFVCRFIFDLMKKFFLCFTFPDDDSHYLIPELLPKNQPDEAKEFDPAQCLNFQYHYTVLPEGILPRFITRTHYLSEGQPRWRSGVILQFENCRALVRADAADKKVFISIKGEKTESRRRLLAVVRSDLERIHNEIKNLNPLEMIPLPGFPNEVIPYKDLLVRENKGEDEVTKVIGDDIEKFSVGKLLSGVDLPVYSSPVDKETDLREVDVFLSYSHKDETFKNELETHLKIWQRQKLIHTWSDREIPPGDKWGTEIDQRLENAEMILLLISADFLASDYCYDIEMKRALERHENGEAKVIPVILRKCNWQGALFGHLQALPTDGNPVTSWQDKDEAWTLISKNIEKVAKEIREWRDSG